MRSRKRRRGFVVANRFLEGRSRVLCQAGDCVFMAQLDMSRSGPVRDVRVWCVLVWDSLSWCSMVHYCLVWYGWVWYSMSCYRVVW